MRRFFEGIDVVDAFSGEASFTIEILVDVGDRGRVRVHTRMPGVNRSKHRSVSARQRYAYPWLHNAVAFGHPSDLLVVLRAVQRMRDRAHQQLRRIARQYRVRVERNYVTDETEPARVADDRRECIPRSAAKELVELSKLPALSLPSHPHILLRIPQTRAVKEKKHILGRVSVPGVQRLDARRRGGKNLIITFSVLGRRIGEVAE